MSELSQLEVFTDLTCHPVLYSRSPDHVPAALALSPAAALPEAVVAGRGRLAALRGRHQLAEGARGRTRSQREHGPAS